MGDTEGTLFTGLIEAIEEHAMLVTPDNSKRFCQVTYASSTHQAGILTQISESDVKDIVLPPQE